MLPNLKKSEGYILVNMILFMKLLFIGIFCIQQNRFINTSSLCPLHLPSPEVSSCKDNPNVPCAGWLLQNWSGAENQSLHLYHICITIPRMEFG